MTPKGSPTRSSPRHAAIAVIGGGIGGLTTAWLLRQSGHDVCYLDASSRPGGFLRSTRRDGFLCESGPSSLRVRGETVRALLEQTGLDRRLVHAAAAARRRLLWTGGRLQAVPSSPWALLRSPLLDWRARVRLLAEPLLPKQKSARPTANAGGEHEETVLEFGRRRLGDAAARTLLAPVVAGMYGGDAARLSAAHALPDLVELERRHGSLTRGFLAQRPRPTPLVSFPDGMETLPRTLAAALAPVQVHADPVALEPDGDGWRVHLVNHGTLSCARVVIAAAPRRAAELLQAVAPAAATQIDGLHFAPIALVHLGFDRIDEHMDLNAFGVLVPPGQGLRLLACQYESSMLAHRTPPGGMLLRAILGGDFDASVLELDDRALTDLALQDLRRCTGLRISPTMVHVERHPRAMPQYHPGHGARLAAIRTALQAYPGLALACHGLEGVGIRTAVEQAVRAARAVSS